MKQYRLVLLTFCCAVFLTVAYAHAQIADDGQPSVLKEDKGQSDYVYDLKLLIKKSKDNIKNVNDKIKEQAVVKRNQQREQKAREYYEQAMKLRDEGRLEEARQLFDKAIKITEHPEMQYYIKESERRSKLQANALEHQESDQERRQAEDQKLATERAETAYQAAVSLYKQQKFREAKDEFQLVEEMSPDYKAVRSYLQIVEQDIIQTEHLDMKEQKKEIERQQKEDEISRLHEKELWRKEIEKKEQERQEQLRKQALGVYEEALKLYGARDYLAAREKFQEVEWVVPDFKATRAYLTRIENDIQNEKRQSIVQRQRDLGKQRWQEVVDEKKTVEERRKAMEVNEKAKFAQVRDQAEYIYVGAVALFEKDLFAQAKEKFNEVDGIYPNYKSTRDYLKRMDDMAKQAAEREAMKKKAEENRRLWDEETARRKAEKEKFKQTITEADGSYETALRLYQSGRLIEAKESFLAVDQRVPDYKSTRSYLKRIDSDIELLAKTQRSQDVIASQKAELEKLHIARDRADVVYNDALAAYNAKDFAAAKAKFQETDGIFPDWKKTRYYLNRIDEDIRLNEEAVAKAARAKEAETLYAQALSSYQAGQFEEAKKSFIAVEVALPNYKQTSAYLEHIDDDILRKKDADLERVRESQVKLLYDQAQVLYQGGQFAEAKEKFLQVEVIYPGYKETSRILGGIDAQIEKQKKDAEERSRNDAAEKVYAQAVALYQTGDFAAAKEKFVQTEVAAPDYKDTPKYLAHVDADIARKTQEDERKAREQQAEPLYIQALGLYREGHYVEARNKFAEVQGVVPGYKDTELYLSRIEKDIRSQEARLAKEEKTRKADGLYSNAVQLYANRKFAEAKSKFQELAGVDPGYNIRTYMSRIDNDIRDEAARQVRARAELQAAEPYAQAVVFYHDNDFESAKIKFLEVEQLAPNYKRARYYLARVDEDARSRDKAFEKERLAKAEALYREGDVLEAAGSIPEAFKKFTDVEALRPDYKDVHVRQAKLRKAALDAGINLPEAASPQVDHDISTEEEKSVALYKEAVGLYKEKKYEEARVQFETLMQLKNGYRSTRQYLDSIKEIQALLAQQKQQSATVSPAPEAQPVQQAPAEEVKSAQDSAARQAVVQAVTAASAAPQGNIPVVRSPAEDSKAIAALAARSSAIYQQIKSLSQDKALSSAASTFAKVDRLIENLEAEHQRLAENLARQKKAEEEAALRAKRKEEEQARRQAKAMAAEKNALKEKAGAKAQEEVEARKSEISQERDDRRKKERADLERLKDEQREAQLKAEILYRQALSALRTRDYPVARERLTDIGKISPGYKDTVILMARLDRSQDEEKLNAEEAGDRGLIKGLAEKATALNLSILELSQKKDYVAVEVKFNDLESILKEIQVSKNRMVQRREQFEARWEEIASQRDSAAKKRMAPKSVKPGEDFISARQKSDVLIRDGQQLYSAENFAEARVKFMDAARADPTNRVAMKYVTRIDRILSQHDYEARHLREKAQVRGLDHKPADLTGAAAAAVPPSTDIKRAVEVAEEGSALYKAKRYREARIKYEELFQVGTEKDKRQANKYLDLIDRAMEKEKQAAEAERQAQEDRLLEERRAQAKLVEERDRRAQEREKHKTQELIAAQRDLDIRRQQELREIERKNTQQRQEMLSKKEQGTSAAVAQDHQERVKFTQQDGPSKEPSSKDAKVLESTAQQQQAQAVRVTKETKLEVTDASAESASKEKIRTSPSKVERRMARADAVDKKERERRAQVAKQLLEIEQAEEKKRQFYLNPAVGKGMDQAELIRRNQQDVKQILKNVAYDGVAVEGASQPSVAAEDPTTALLKQAASEERRLLDAQRVAIRKEFEAGTEQLYLEAIGFYKKKMYQDARQDFEQVNGLIQGYKDTDKYLKKIDRVLNSNTSSSN